MTRGTPAHHPTVRDKGQADWREGTVSCPRLHSLLPVLGTRAKLSLRSRQQTAFLAPASSLQPPAIPILGSRGVWFS